jgi:hypothetical protein
VNPHRSLGRTCCARSRPATFPTTGSSSPR